MSVYMQMWVHCSGLCYSPAIPLEKTLHLFSCLGPIDIGSFQVYMSDLDPPPKGCEEEGAAVTVDVWEGGGQKAGAVLSQGTKWRGTC